MSSYGDAPELHRIVSGRFVCTASPEAPCRNYPACECETWNPAHHEHPNVPQEECWQAPWIQASDLSDTYALEELLLDDDEFPDGPVATTWEGDYLLWEYADDTRPDAKPWDES